MNNKKYLLLSIVFVFVMAIAISGGTFAYFQWSLGYSSGTGVNVTIEMGGITMHIEPEQTEFSGLYPTNNCKNKSSYGDALVTIVNNTGTLAIPSFKLKVRVLKGGSGELTSDILKHIRYTVVPLETTKDAAGNPVKGDLVTDHEGYIHDCSYPMFDWDSGNYRDSILFVNSFDEWGTLLKFEDVATDGSWSHIPSCNNETYSPLGSWFNLDGDDCGYLPRQYYIDDGNTGFSKGEVNGITFRGEAYSTSYQYFRVYVWIDSAYTATTVGDVITDPLQNAKIEVTWSEESMIQQVSGESIVEEETELAAGLYDSDGNMVYTWDELVDNGDITLYDSDNYGRIPDYVNTSLTGELIIPEGIVLIEDNLFNYSSLSFVTIPNSVTYIGENVFSNSNITEVKFGENSQLASISPYTFEDSSITSIEIPASVVEISEYAFGDSDLLNTIKFEGTKLQWNAITKGENWNTGVPAVEVICSDGTVTLREAGLYDSDGNMVYTWDELVDNGDITLSGTTITDSNRELTGELIIPEGITSIGFASFGGEDFYTGFQGVSLLNSVYIPSSVTSVEGSAFIEMTSLISVTFAPGSQLTEIGDYAFAGTDIRNIKIPSSVTIVGDSAFSGTPLANIEISKNVEIIKNYAFSGCGSLETIIFRGNISEWNAIIKGDVWNGGVPATEVICSDGRVSL